MQQSETLFGLRQVESELKSRQRDLSFERAPMTGTSIFITMTMDSQQSNGFLEAFFLCDHVELEQSVESRVRRKIDAIESRVREPDYEKLSGYLPRSKIED